MVRNPKYPEGMTLGQLIDMHISLPNCHWCHRSGDLNDPEVHDGMCPMPFLVAARNELGWLRWALNIVFRYWMVPTDDENKVPSEKHVYRVLAQFDQEHREPKGTKHDPGRGDP